MNTNLLRAKIIENGLNYSKIAEKLGINEATLYRKMSGKSDFNRNEIKVIKNELHLSNDEVDIIFFTT